MKIVSQDGTRLVDCKYIWIEKLVLYPRYGIEERYQLDYDGYLECDRYKGKGFCTGYSISTKELGVVARYATLDFAKKALLLASELDAEGKTIRFNELTVC
jgi:hypothetical protein